MFFAENADKLYRKPGNTQKALKKCVNTDRHQFKVVIYTKNGRKTKAIQTRNLDEAILEATAFKLHHQNQVENPSVEIKQALTPSSISPRQPAIPETDSAPTLFVHSMARFIGWINGDAPVHLRKNLSPDYVADIERVLIEFSKCLEDTGHNLNSFTVENINDKVVGEIYDHLINKGSSNRTLNKKIGFLSNFINWHIDQFDRPQRNYFKKVVRKKTKHNPLSISKEEYEALLKIITPENGTKVYSGDVVKPIRQMYRDWLKSSIQLGLLTGRRREEIINLKFNHIIEENGRPNFIECFDGKVNNIKHLEGDDRKIIYIPVTDSLLTLLQELGYEERKGTDAPILAPDLSERGRAMCDTMSRGFSHYYQQLNTGRNLTLKSLRKAYITGVSRYFQGDTKSITGHSDDAVIQAHYIDRMAIAKSMQDFEVFPETNNRKQELTDIREEQSKSINQQKNR